MAAPIRSDDPAYKKRLRRKNLVLLALLIGLVAVFYLVTVIKVGGNL